MSLDCSCDVISFLKTMGPTIPICLTILVIIFSFREFFKKLLSNKFSIKFKDFEANFFGMMDGLKSNPNQGEGFNKINDAFESELVSNNIKLIRKQIKDDKLTDQETISIFIRQLSYTQFLVLLMRIDKAIYHAQIQLLNDLNQSILCFNSQKIEEYYNLLLPDQKSVTKDVQSFLWFLQNFNLIFSGPLGYSITQTGKDYLKFRIQNAQPITFK